MNQDKPVIHRWREALELCNEMTAANPRNIHWHNLKPGARGGLLPHIVMYRECLERFLSTRDLDALSSKRLEFLMARFPRFLANAPCPRRVKPSSGS